MKKIKSILGYAWAAATVVIVLASFMGNNYLSRALASATGITVHPKYSGGEVGKIVEHGSYKTFIYRPVFNGLIGEKKEGFIQIKWEPAASLPKAISEGIDYNGDGRDDFIITLDTVTGKTTLGKNNQAVLNGEKSYHLSNGWAVRVLLKRQP